MRSSVRPGALIATGFALMVPALALASSDAPFAMSADAKYVMLSLPALLMGIGFHEWAHAWVAWRLGDSTPEEDGRLSLNPLDHLDPLGALLILAAMFWHLPLIGWGKPVAIRRAAFRDPIRDTMKVALAGPMMNLAVVAGSLLAYHAFMALLSPLQSSLGATFVSNTTILLTTLILTNASLAMFNMLPIPPLDGSKVLENFVSARTVISMREIEPYGILILYGLINTPLLAGPNAVLCDGTIRLMRSLGFAAAYTVVVGAAWLHMVRSVRRRY